MMQINQTNPNVFVHWMSYIIPNPIMDWLLSFLMPISIFFNIPVNFVVSLSYVILCFIVSLIIYAGFGSSLMAQMLLIGLIVTGLGLGLIPLSMWWILIVLAIMFTLWSRLDREDIVSSAVSNNLDVKSNDSVLAVSSSALKEEKIAVDKERITEKRGALTIRK